MIIRVVSSLNDLIEALAFSLSEIILGNHETSVFWCGTSHKEHVSNLEWEVTQIPLK